MRRAKRGILYASAAIVIALPITVWLITSTPQPRGPSDRADLPAANATDGAVLASAVNHRTDSRSSANNIPDPLSLTEKGWQNYQKNISAYRCLLTKQERVGGDLSPLQDIDVIVREDPLAIYMKWIKNAGEVRRALHQSGQEYLDSKGRKLARVEPGGAIARLFVKDIFIPIHSDRARKVSRRTIDECGFRSIFQLFEKYARLAKAEGVLDLRYVGTGTVDGRPTHVIERYLPYQGDGGKYPDAKLVMHLDKELLLPVALYSYADREGNNLLGKYLFRNIEINPQFDSKTFEF